MLETSSPPNLIIWQMFWRSTIIYLKGFSLYIYIYYTSLWARVMHVIISYNISNFIIQENNFLSYFYFFAITIAAFN